MTAMKYEKTGVDYGLMDPFKVAALKAARSTAKNIARLGSSAVMTSYGESTFLTERSGLYLAHTNEGLGTKSLVADAMHGYGGRTFYDGIGQDTLAMIVNDMITLGALPESVEMHLAVGNSEWFADTARYLELIDGWWEACRLAGCAWGGGETPTLKDIVLPQTAMLGGSAVGIIKPKERLIRGNIRAGDAIVGIGSSGIHANGLTLARKIAAILPDGFMTRLGDGRTYGEALLDPTRIYVGLVEACLYQGVKIHYAVNVTGHGWRKLMRVDKPFVYRIEKLPTVPLVLKFMQEQGPISLSEAYGNLNMGMGFALYVPEDAVGAVRKLAGKQGLPSLRVGHIETAKEKKVVIEPLGIEYPGETLKIR